MKTTLLRATFTLVACSALAADSSNFNIIPRPEKIEPRDGVFEIRPDTSIRVESAGRDTGQFLAEKLRAPTGYPLLVSKGSKSKASAGEILLTTRNAPPGTPPEAYELIVAPDAVVISAAAPAGLFYGVQSLLQLLPPDIFSGKPVPNRLWEIPCVQIQDRPRFAWRGLLLDVARHFYTKAEIKQLLDLMAAHKLNTLQLHLTDDQGWRVEIKKYPKLTQVGAWRKGVGFGLDPKATTAYGSDGRYGGYYSQTDIRELVNYAATRHIIIVPEIEMPGHSSAALAAYPEFSCFGGPYNTDLDGVVNPGVFCAGKDQSFQFLQDVLAEVIDLFPGKYIHIGGDEVPKGNWQKCLSCQARRKQEGLKTEHELQSYFVRRIEQYLNSRGRTLVGWSEIREGGLARNAVVMDWIGGAVEAATAGHDVVMTPKEYCYLDYYQSSNHEGEPRAIGGYLPLNQAYSFDPIPPQLNSEFRFHIIGAQANLWTEYIASFKHAQYMAFPRLCALAEVFWSPQSSRNYDEFLQRFQAHATRLEVLGVNYRRLKD